MMTTAFITHPDYLLHTLPGHPEHAGRLERIEQVLAQHKMNERLLRPEPSPASVDTLAFVHQPLYGQNVREICERGGGHLDPDTYTLPVSYEVARLAAGGATLAVDTVVTGTATNAFAALRPPGHHATPTRGMGFCLFNNIAVAARHAQRKHDLERVLIVDFDVHHGNGTQDAFYDDKSVLFVSSHLYPFYPGTGAMSDVGIAEGRGYTLNMPLPGGVGNEGFKALYEKVLWPVARRFKPQLLLVSAGFDAHWSDPLANLKLDLSGYAYLARELKAMAEELCQGRLIFILEGGYQLEALSHGVLNVLYALLGRDEVVDPLGPAGGHEPSIDGRLNDLLALHEIG
jgi:acetoin utilization deacetylase AcuC-like enzyme